MEECHLLYHIRHDQSVAFNLFLLLVKANFKSQLRHIWTKTVKKYIFSISIKIALQKLKLILKGAAPDEKIIFKFGPRAKKFGHPCTIWMGNLLKNNILVFSSLSFLRMGILVQVQSFVWQQQRSRSQFQYNIQKAVLFHYQDIFLLKYKQDSFLELTTFKLC